MARDSKAQVELSQSMVRQQRRWGAVRQQPMERCGGEEAQLREMEHEGRMAQHLPPATPAFRREKAQLIVPIRYPLLHSCAGQHGWRAGEDGSAPALEARSSSWTTGQQDNRTTGQQDNRTTGQQDNRTTGQQDNRTTGQQDNRTTRQQDNMATWQHDNIDNINSTNDIRFKGGMRR
ncbi:hypothetical protein CLOM_g12332 [Closterium sp. NIES-68]|nr:hypothetical protein CLOM_g12332 [Closterium sp. NIES-68]